VVSEEPCEGGLLLRKEVLRMGAKSGEIAAMIFDVRGEFTHEIHEVLLDDPNDVESVRDDPGVGEVPLNQGAVGTAQIHADYADVFLAPEGREVSVELFRGTAFHNIEDLVSSQIAEGGREAGAASMLRSLSMDGVFIDTENRRADAIGVLASFAGGILVVEALD
jgi:hypothetical protein